MCGFKNNPIFICGHRKSGTTLMLNSLDSHPELSVFPVDSNFFYKYYPVCETEKYSKNKKISVMINGIIANLENDLDKFSKKDRDDIKFNITEFKKDFLSLVEKTEYQPKDMLISLALAFKKNYLNLSTQTKWVEKTTSTEIYAMDVFKWFPHAKFIHIVRDPRDNWASLKSGWNKRYKKFNDSKERLLQSLIDRCKIGMEFAKYNQILFGKERYKVIRYEDLTTSPDTTLKDVSKFLKIQFNEIMLKPTIFGKLWSGNNFEGLKFTEISDFNANRWKERIDTKESKIIEYYFADIMKFFGYKLEYDLSDTVNATKEHYKWFNFSQKYSYSPTKNLSA